MNSVGFDNQKYLQTHPDHRGTPDRFQSLQFRSTEDAGYDAQGHDSGESEL